MRTFYLRGPGAQRPNWAEFAEVVSIPADTAVRKIVARVAEDLGMQPSQWDRDTYVIETDHDNGFSLSMHVIKQAKSLWLIRLVDWPTTNRSDLSWAAEWEILTRLEFADEERLHHAQSSQSPSE